MASRITDVEDFLSTSRKEYEEDRLRDKADRELGEEDNAFANSPDSSLSQWTPATKEMRENLKRPVLQWNRIPTYLQQVQNAGRANRPAIKISPGDNGTPETAEFFQERIRQVEYESKADEVYDTARDQQTASGRAFIRIITEKVPGTERQVVRIKAIENEFSVCFGPGREYDRSDSDRCWVVTQITKEQHRRLYGENSLLNRTDFATTPETLDWVGIGERGDMVQIAEKFQLIRDGDEVVCCRYVINGAEILEEGEFPVGDIPIVPQWGRTKIVNGVEYHYSLHHNAKGPQKLVNLYVSNIAEIIANQNKGGYTADVRAIPAHLMEDWKNAAWSPKLLLYNSFDEQGRPIAKPERDVSEPPIQALSIGLQQAIEGIKAAMGMFDASMGARSNETTGIAIEQRRKQTDIVNYHYPSNESRTRRRIGQILIKLIPLLDKPGMEVPIRHEDGKTEVIPIGKPYQHKKTGQMITHVLTDGDYGIVVDTAPSYASAREEIQERDQALIAAAPEMLFVIGDELMRTQDYPGAEKRAERMERYINMKTPGLIPPDENAPQQVSPQVQQYIQQLEQKLAQTEAFAKDLHEKQERKLDELNNQALLKKMDVDIKREELAFKREELAEKSRVELAKMGLESDIVALKAEIEVIKQQAGLNSQRQEAEAAREHEASQAAADREFQAGEAEAGRQHESREADAGRAHEAQQAKEARETEPAGADK